MTALLHVVEQLHPFGPSSRSLVVGSVVDAIIAQVTTQAMGPNPRKLEQLRNEVDASIVSLNVNICHLWGRPKGPPHDPLHVDVVCRVDRDAYDSQGVRIDPLTKGKW